MPLNDMPAQARLKRHGAFQIHRVARLEIAQIAAFERLRREIGGKTVRANVDRGEANSVNGDTCAHCEIGEHAGTTDRQAGSRRFNPTQLFDDSGEHSNVLPHVGFDGKLVRRDHMQRGAFQ